MKKTILAAALLAALSARAQALVWKVYNESSFAVVAKAHNTQSGCSDYSKSVAASNGYAQYDWRGGCTGSCATTLQLTYTSKTGVSVCRRFQMNPMDFRATCRTRAFHIIDSPKGDYPMFAEFDFTLQGTCE